VPQFVRVDNEHDMVDYMDLQMTRDTGYLCHEPTGDHDRYALENAIAMTQRDYSRSHYSGGDGILAVLRIHRCKLDIIMAA
jgi:hypothetical protein